MRGRRARGPRLVRITLAGEELAGFDEPEPASSVRLLVPTQGELVLPTWRGNEFLAPDGTRPPIRTVTPVRFDPEVRELDVEIVLHGEGALSSWAAAAQPGSPVAVSGPGRGYRVDPSVRRWLLAGDETALPAIGVLLDVLPGHAEVEVLVEVADPGGRVDLPEHPRCTVGWLQLPAGAAPGDALVAALAGSAGAVAIPEGTEVWVAAEAAAVQRIRRHLFEERGLPRSQATVRGYWKQGRSGAGWVP